MDMGGNRGCVSHLWRFQSFRKRQSCVGWREWAAEGESSTRGGTVQRLVPRCITWNYQETGGAEKQKKNKKRSGHSTHLLGTWGWRGYVCGEGQEGLSITEIHSIHRNVALGVRERWELSLWLEERGPVGSGWAATGSWVVENGRRMVGLAVVGFLEPFYFCFRVALGLHFFPLEFLSVVINWWYSDFSVSSFIFKLCISVWDFCVCGYSMQKKDSYIYYSFFFWIHLISISLCKFRPLFPAFLCFCCHRLSPDNCHRFLNCNSYCPLFLLFLMLLLPLYFMLYLCIINYSEKEFQYPALSVCK